MGRMVSVGIMLVTEVDCRLLAKTLISWFVRLNKQNLLPIDPSRVFPSLEHSLIPANNTTERQNVGETSLPRMSKFQVQFPRNHPNLGVESQPPHQPTKESIKQSLLVNKVDQECSRTNQKAAISKNWVNFSLRPSPAPAQKLLFPSSLSLEAETSDQNARLVTVETRFTARSPQQRSP